MTFGQRLYQLRKERGLSQEELAKIVFVTRQSVSLWENDKAMPSVDILIKLSSIFNISLDELLRNQSEIVKPLATAKLLSDKKEIKKAMTCQLFTSINILLSLASFSLVLFIALQLICCFMPQYNQDNSVFVIYTVIFLSIGFSLLVSKYSAIKAAQHYMKNKSGSINFFADYMIVNFGKEQETMCITYFQLKRILESDYYICFKTNLGWAFCIDKGSIEEDIKNLQYPFKAYKAYKNKCVLKPEAEKEYSFKTLTRMKRISDILFIYSILSIWVGIITWFTLMTAGSTLPYFYYVPALIPMCGLIVGIVLKLKETKGVKLIVTSSIMLVVAILYSSITMYSSQNMIISPAADYSAMSDETFAENLLNLGFEIEDKTKSCDIDGIEKYISAECSDGNYEIIFADFENAQKSYLYASDLKSEFAENSDGGYYKTEIQNPAVNEYSATTNSRYMQLCRKDDIVICLTSDISHKDEAALILSNLFVEEGVKIEMIQ